MRKLYEYLKMLAGFVLFITCLAFSEGSSPANAEDQIIENENSSVFALNASIMEIDLNNGRMIIAEKYIYLPHSTQQSGTKWETEFIDSNGQKISITSLHKNDRVLAEGTTTASGVMNAQKITLLASEKGLSKEKITEGSNKLPPQTPSPIRLIDGVWTN
ncbi:MAG: hypothetical protein JZU65_19935 [Chlorobium sp.]|nr:hypothetical protein [Chlorobium sp.]